MTIMTEKCISDDLTDSDHNRCVGAVFVSWFDQGKPCQCPCHSLPRCFSPYIADHGTGVYACGLHEGHGGNFHERSIGGGSVMWSIHADGSGDRG